MSSDSESASFSIDCWGEREKWGTNHRRRVDEALHRRNSRQREAGDAVARRMRNCSQPTHPSLPQISSTLRYAEVRLLVRRWYWRR